MSLDEAATFLTSHHPSLTAALLFFSSIIEYCFPPFPGDTVTLAGAVLVTAYGYSPLALMTAVTLGSLIGASLDFLFGLALRRLGPPSPQKAKFFQRVYEGATVASKAIARHGEIAIVLNRFMPGIRAFVFVAAGFARLKFWKVLFYAAVSSILWNAILIAAGMALGTQLERLERAFTTYNTFAWIAIGLVALLFLARYLRRRPSRFVHSEDKESEAAK